MSRRSSTSVAGGPPLVVGAGLGLLAMLAAIALYAGTAEAGVRTMIRATARTSLLLFALAFAASSLRRLWPSPLTTWLLRNRRYLGISFFLSHVLHLVAILVVAARWPHPFREESATPLALIGGGLGYLFLFALTATSWNGAVAWLGGRRWRRLHTVGSYYLWVIFAQAYVGRAFESPLYLPFALLVLAPVAVRAAARWRARQEQRPALPPP